jgi:hypothetical protein
MIGTISPGRRISTAALPEIGPRLIRMADRRRIGIDLDNTLINYDAVFCAFAEERGLLDSDKATSKAAIREALRALPEGDLVWQRLQGAVYGKGVRRAVLFDGAAVFLQRARERGCEVFIVSHKTEFGHFDPDRVNLRDAAMDWMKGQGFFREDGFGIPNGNVLFAATRSDKIAAIAELDVEVFIDDLPEVLEDKGFPATVVGLLFTAGEVVPSAYPRAFAHWRDITRTVFG